MNIHHLQSFPRVTAYGQGALGGKGAGLVRINECDLPRTAKLLTHVLTTDFFERYLERNCAFGSEELAIIRSILETLGDVPVGVRSSATNEAGVLRNNTVAVHAGEHLSFMLPNNHSDPAVRFNQLVLAVRHIYDHFLQQHGRDPSDQMAIVINPIPGLFDDTLAGPCFYPYISGVANSFFPYALKTQDPGDGFARIAFGHGYATVLDDFPVISMATIRNPIPLNLLQVGGGQQYFYSLDLTKNSQLQGEELETMKKLHVRFANFHKIRLLGVSRNIVTIEELVQNDHFGFKTGLQAIMEGIAAHVSSQFQIEFVFNIDFKHKPYEDGLFHVVQLTVLPSMTFDTIDIPEQGRHTYLSIRNLQGHGVKAGVKYAVVVSPFLYVKEQHDHVRQQLSAINARMRASGEKYLAIVPGRLGSRNPEWGIAVDYKDVDQAVAIFEYGVDIAGRVEPLPEKENLTGGIYGSHFLYMVMGGYSEEQKRIQTRMYGTQGTHFFTNIMSNNLFYGYISPLEDTFDPWFFSPPPGTEAIYILEFPTTAAIYADSVTQRCVVLAESD